ncbi:MAG: Uma2 family endonuclease, partial [Dolichospermum sp.]
ETAEQETKRAEKEARKSERLAAKLRELNIDPDTI